jgi:hypothetical protein
VDDPSRKDRYPTVDPVGTREMVNGNRRTNVARTKCIDNTAVVRNGIHVDHVAARFDARPVDTEAIGVEVELRDKIEIGHGVGVAAHGVTNKGSVAETAHGCGSGPCVPIVVGEHVFNLCSCGCNAE